MTPSEARQLIEVLASGVDPNTGEVLAEDSTLNHPRVIRALFLATKALELTAAKPPRAASDLPAKAGKSWSEDEDQRLLTGFDSGLPVAALAQAHDRTTGAITSRLIRLGRLQVGREEMPPPGAMRK